MLAAAYVASEIVLPLVFAIVLKLLLQPVLRVLERLHAASSTRFARAARRAGKAPTSCAKIRSAR